MGLREQAAVDLMAVDVDEGTGGPTGDDAKRRTPQLQELLRHLRRRLNPDQGPALL